MSYLKRWRKVRSTATAIALESSSTSEDNNSDRPRASERDHQIPDAVSEEESGLHASDSESDNSSDFGFNENVDSSDVDSINGDDNICEEDEPTFQEKIATWCTENRTTRSGVNQLLEILRSEGHPLPKDARTLLQTPRVIHTEDRCGGTYAYFGLKSSIIKVLSTCLNFDNLQIPGQIELLVNIDGIPLFKSSGSQFWPILCSFGEESPFLVGLFYGKSKPNSVHEFLRDFLTEYSEINQNGILYENITVKIKIKSFVCDAPARAFLKCIKSHTGYYACERCVIKGTWKNNRIVLSEPDSALRTNEDFARKAYADHQKDISPLQTAGFNCVNGFSLDYMHLVCLGVVKRLLTFLKRGPSECKLSQRQITEISGELLSFSGKLPSEFARQPRTLFEIDRWKATEFRQFLLYTGPVVLKKILHKNTYSHFLCLTISISILLDENDQKRAAYLDYARQLLNYFVDKSKDIYSDHFQVYNVHNLKHLSDDVEHFQCSLNDISAFPFENHLQIIKRLVRNSKNPIGQVGKRISELETTIKGQSTTKKYTKLRYISANKRNGCLLLKNEDFAFVTEKRPDGNLLCDVIRQQHLDSFFTEPCDSKIINIALMRNSSRCRSRLVGPEEVYRKVVCLPYGRGHILLPLLHGMERHKW